MIVKSEYRIRFDELTPETMEKVCNELHDIGYRVIQASDHVRFIKNEYIELYENLED